MTVRHYVDFAPQTAVSIPINSTDVVVTLLTLSGYPSAFPYLAVIDAGTVSQEVVTVSGAVGAVATIIRNQNGLGAFSHLAGATWAHMSTATDFTEANTHVNATTGIHGLTGGFVGTTDVQTLTNKTISATSLTVAGVPAARVVANFAALPGSPVDGQMAWTSDTELLWSYNATSTTWDVQSPRKQTYTATLDSTSSVATTGSSGANISTTDVSPTAVPYPSLMTVRVSAMMTFNTGVTASDEADLVITRGGTAVQNIRVQPVPGGTTGTFSVSRVFTVALAASASPGAWNWHVKKVAGTGIFASVTLDATYDLLQFTIEPS